MEKIRKDSAHSYEDGTTWDTVFETVKEGDELLMSIVQNSENNDISFGKNEVELNESEMLVLY